MSQLLQSLEKRACSVLPYIEQGDQDTLGVTRADRHHEYVIPNEELMYDFFPTIFSVGRKDVMKTTFKGTATPAAMEPLLVLAALPVGLTLTADGSGNFSSPIGRGGSVTLSPDDPVIRMTWHDGVSDLISDLPMQIWGDVNSGPYWFPFGFIASEMSDSEEGSSVDLTDTICRAKEFLGRVSFTEDEDTIIAPEGNAAAAVNYMRCRSGVTDPWIISLAGPFELRLDDESFGEGDGLLMEFGELPPGLDMIGECALVQPESITCSSWQLRPVMCQFDEPCCDTPKALETARTRLELLGFSTTQIERLDAVAAGVADAYEWATDVAA